MDAPTNDVSLLAVPSECGAFALCVGRGIELKNLPFERLASNPLLVRAGTRGVAAVLRYGSVVFFDVTPAERVEFMTRLGPYVAGRLPESVQEEEELELRIVSGGRDRTDAAGLELGSADTERLQLIGDVLAKSVLLAYYETSIAEAFSAIEPLAATLERRGRAGRAKDLVRHVGAALLVEHQMVWRAEVLEKPDLLWDRPDLDRLFFRLAKEYELKDRQVALDHKLNLLSRTASTLLSLLYEQRSLRVEWYIVVLIAVEIAITVYTLG